MSQLLSTYIPTNSSTENANNISSFNDTSVADTETGPFRSLISKYHPFVNESWGRDIFWNASAVNTTFVEIKIDNSNDPRAFLHMGAVDANGHPYIHNVTSLRHNPPPFNQSLVQDPCNPRDGYVGIMRQLEILSPNPPNPPVPSSPTTHSLPAARRPIQLFCAVYSVGQYHATKVATLRETWGPKCDGFLVASDTADPQNYDAVKMLHLGPEHYKNMWNKVQSMWGYIYDHYYNDYDFFHIGGDDMWLVVENLRNYLNSDEIYLAQQGGRPHGLPQPWQFPIFLGQAFPRLEDPDFLYNTGGPGYTLNKAALKLLITEILPTAMDKSRNSMEDVFIARCFRDYERNRVYPYPTRDDQYRHRYNTFSPYRDKIRNFPKYYEPYMRLFKGGMSQRSNHSVSFHYVQPPEMRRLHAMAYLCPKEG